LASDNALIAVREAWRVAEFVVVGAVKEDADEDVFLAGQGEFFLGAAIKGWSAKPPHAALNVRQ
jgi:hypothetical protein